MAKRKMDKPYQNTGSAIKNYNANVVVLLAYMHRYLFPIALGVIPLLIANRLGQDHLYMLWGCGFLLFALYDIVGYQCKWRHLYCSRQDASHQKMTPHHVHWNDLKKSDIYGMPAFMVCFGVILIIVSFLKVGS